ncbi:MAG: MAPEG family protein [Pseudomonadota bacterium]
MTTELTYLALCALLASAMWVPYIVGVNLHPSENIDADFRRPRDLNTTPPWVHRAHRAHLNLIEQLVPLAVLLIIAHQFGISNSVTIWATIIFFWLRVAHAIGMISGIARFPLRPILFTASWACVLAIGWQVMVS